MPGTERVTKIRPPAPPQYTETSPTDQHQARKRFGQNFLHDPAVVQRLVAAIAPRPEEVVLEIGPGLGVLTAPLLEKGCTVHAVELDRDLCDRLTDRFGHLERFHLHQGDALKFDLATLGELGKLRVVGNLPYNISTPLLFHLIKQTERIADMHFMLQLEVMQRLTAEAGSKAYGRLGIMVQLDCETEYLFKVGPGAFRPAPKVTSAFLRVRPRAAAAAQVHDRRRFADLIQRLFSHRRKTLRSILKGQLTAETIADLGIDPGSRPERLSLQELVMLSNSMGAALE